VNVTASGIVFDTRAAPANEQSASATSALLVSDGTLLVTMRLGTDREGPDGHTAILASDDLGDTWRIRYLGLTDRDWDGVRGETRGWMLAELEPGVLTASVLYIDRSDPERPWVNQQTQGLLPMRVYQLTSRDGGWTWQDRHRIDLAPHPGASATGPVMRLADGALAQPFEHWKEYDEERPGRPGALLRLSRDGGRTWPDDILVARDPDNAIFYWDQRLASHPTSGELVAMFWTHEPGAGRDRDIHIAWAGSDGRGWTDPPVPTGLPGQHCQPIPVGGDRLVAVYTHRGDPPGIRAVLSEDFGRTWDRATEVTLYASEAGREPGSGGSRSQADYWNDMGAWQFGHPRGVRLPTGEVFAVFYGGTGDTRPARWARFTVD
jgi:hypothetical protein